MSTTAKASPEHDALVPASHTAAPAWTVTCLNCGTSLIGPFCSHCGQRAAPPHPRLHDLGGEALSEFSGWDGKLASTLKLLVMKPGELTRQFLEGRRAHYISPLRLYLAASVLFFALTLRPHSAKPTTTPAAPVTPAAAKAAAKQQELLQSIETAPAIMRPMIRRAATDQKAFGEDVTEALPKALFVMLPVFAAILMLFYPRRHFAEHLYFSIHLHAFIFAALDVAVLTKFSRSPAIALGSLIAVSLWVPLYTHLAIRRVYGGSQGITLAKELGISVLYALASIPAITLLAMWVAWTTT